MRTLETTAPKHGAIPFHTGLEKNMPRARAPAAATAACLPAHHHSFRLLRANTTYHPTNISRYSTVWCDAIATIAPSREHKLWRPAIFVSAT